MSEVRRAPVTDLRERSSPTPAGLHSGSPSNALSSTGPSRRARGSAALRYSRGLRPKVLLLVTLSDWGGAPHAVSLLAGYLQREYDVTVACGAGGELVRRLAGDDVRIVSIPELARTPHPWRDLRAFLRLVRLMEREHFQIVHAHSTKAGLLGRLAARLAGVPVVLFTAHGWAFTDGRPWWTRWPLVLVERLGAALSTKIICVSHHDRDLAVRSRIAPSGRLVTIRNGADPERFGRRDGGRVRHALGIRAEPVVTFVGRLAPQKDPVGLLEAFGALSGGTLMMVGEGPLREAVERRIRETHLKQRVILLDPRPDVAGLLAASDIFVLPSRWEGLPFVIIEAMMSGLPVVATRVGGVPELVEDGLTGVLVPPGDPKALEHALARLLSDPRLRRRMGAAGGAKALREFRLDRMISETSHLYEELVAAAGLSTRAAPFRGGLTHG